MLSIINELYCIPSDPTSEEYELLSTLELQRAIMEHTGTAYAVEEVYQGMKQAGFKSVNLGGGEMCWEVAMR